MEYQTISLKQFFPAKGVIYYVAIAMVKISCFHTKAHLVFHWCLYNKYIYKITKIVHALWLAERSVCIRVCKHGCGVKLFGFLHANHASTNLKNFPSSKLNKFTLFIHSFVGWNLENHYKEGVSIFLRLSWHFKREKSAVCTAPFCNFATGKNFSFNQCHTKSFAFFPGKVIL